MTYVLHFLKTKGWPRSSQDTMVVIIGQTFREANQLQGFETDGDLGREIGDRPRFWTRVLEAEGVESEVCKSNIHVFLFLQSIVCYYIKMTVMAYKKIKIDSMAEKRMYIGWHVICNTGNKFSWRLSQEALFGSYSFCPVHSTDFKIN